VKIKVNNLKSYPTTHYGKTTARSPMKKILFILLILLFLTISTFATLYYLAPKPPLSILEQCHRTIATAKEQEAEKYAPGLIKEAEIFFEGAKEALQKENEKTFFLRDYNTVIQLVESATAKAAEATKKVTEDKQSLSESLQKKLIVVSHKIDHFDETYAHLPLNKKARKDFTNAKLKYLESKKAYERKAYLLVGNNLDEANKLISKSVDAAHDHLSSYFDDLPLWKRWHQETVEWSRKNGGTAIVVDKFAHMCYVYKGGKEIKRFNAELGPNWIGTKKYRGDKATPEGKYHITKKKAGSQTIYYKALLINYPNEEDKIRYNKNVRNGSIPKRGIGNLIELHGGGGKGINWTEGCVALTNEDIDKLWNYVSTGTPITIVGSLRSLHEINGR